MDLRHAIGCVVGHARHSDDCTPDLDELNPGRRCSCGLAEAAFVLNQFSNELRRASSPATPAPRKLGRWARFWAWLNEPPPKPPGWHPFSPACPCRNCRHEDLCRRTWTC